MLWQERQLLTFTTAYLYGCSPLRLLTFTARNRKGFLFWWLRLRELSTWRVESLVVVYRLFTLYYNIPKIQLIEYPSQYLRHSRLYGLSQAPSHFHTPILTPMLRNLEFSHTQKNTASSILGTTPIPRIRRRVARGMAQATKQNLLILTRLNHLKAYTQHSLHVSIRHLRGSATAILKSLG